MDEELVETEVPSVGERLRAAREEKKMSLEDIAAQTRIPQRHLESLEVGNWAALPAPTYTIGFARSYATAVGLDRTEISDQLRSEMGGSRPPTAAAAEVFEPADPARTMPKWLVFGAIAAVILIVLVMSWLNKRSLDQPADANAAVAEAPAAAPQAPPAGAAHGSAVRSRVDRDRSRYGFRSTRRAAQSYSPAMMVPGQSFTVPPTATAPVLKTGKPEALRITVGNSVAPPVGPPATTVSNVSLLPADLMRGGQAPAPQPATAAPRRRLGRRPPAGRAQALARFHRSGSPRRRRRRAADQHYRLTEDSCERKPRRGTIARLPSVGNSSEIFRQVGLLAASRELRFDSGSRAGPAPTADTRTAPRPPRATDPADAAPGLSQGTPGRHRGLFGRAGGDPVRRS